MDASGGVGVCVYIYIYVRKHDEAASLSFSRFFVLTSVFFAGVATQKRENRRSLLRVVFDRDDGRALCLRKLLRHDTTAVSVHD